MFQVGFLLLLFQSCPIWIRERKKAGSGYLSVLTCLAWSQAPHSEFLLSGPLWLAACFTHSLSPCLSGIQLVVALSMPGLPVWIDTSRSIPSIQFCSLRAPILSLLFFTPCSKIFITDENSRGPLNLSWNLSFHTQDLVSIDSSIFSSWVSFSEVYCTEL